MEKSLVYVCLLGLLQFMSRSILWCESFPLQSIEQGNHREASRKSTKPFKVVCFKARCVRIICFPDNLCSLVGRKIGIIMSSKTNYFYYYLIIVHLFILMIEAHYSNCKINILVGNSTTLSQNIVICLLLLLIMIKNQSPSKIIASKCKCCGFIRLSCCGDTHIGVLLASWKLLF